MKRAMVIVLALAVTAAAPATPSLSGPPLQLEFTNRGIDSAAFSADGKRIAVGLQARDETGGGRWGELRIHDLTTGKEVARLAGHQDSPSAMAFSLDGKRLVSITTNLERIHWNLPSAKAEFTDRG